MKTWLKKIATNKQPLKKVGGLTFKTKMTKDQIKKFRLDNFPGKTSRQKLAEKTGYAPRSIKAYELGQRPIPGPYIIILKSLKEYRKWIKSQSYL